MTQNTSLWIQKCNFEIDGLKGPLTSDYKAKNPRKNERKVKRDYITQPTLKLIWKTSKLSFVRVARQEAKESGALSKTMLFLWRKIDLLYIRFFFHYLNRIWLVYSMYKYPLVVGLPIGLSLFWNFLAEINKFSWRKRYLSLISTSIYCYKDLKQLKIFLIRIKPSIFPTNDFQIYLRSSFK